jgi:hypothetical protein
VLPVAEIVVLGHAQRVGLRDNCLTVMDPAAPGTGDALTDAWCQSRAARHDHTLETSPGPVPQTITS